MRTLQAVIDCVVKACLCHETKPDIWGQVQLAGLKLRRRRELEQYHELIPDKVDCWDKWDAALDDPVKNVTLLLEHCNNEEQRAASNEWNLAR